MSCLKIIFILYHRIVNKKNHFDYLQFNQSFVYCFNLTIKFGKPIMYEDFRAMSLVTKEQQAVILVEWERQIIEFAKGLI